MQVILLEHIRRLGDIGDVVAVRNGYARNFLIPRKKVLRATPGNIAIFEQQRAEMEKVNAAKFKAAEGVAKKLEGLVISLIRQASEDGKLYGSISTKEVAAAIMEAKGIEVDTHDIAMGPRIKNLGVYDIGLSLHPKLQVLVKLVVARNEESVEAMLLGVSSEKAGKQQAEEDAIGE